MVGMQCINCEHYQGLQECPAFKGQIPQNIYEGSFIHDKLHKDQINNLYLYTPIDEEVDEDD